MTEAPASVRPLRAATIVQQPESNEARFLSAMIESGTFVPQKYGVELDDLTCWRPVWVFCETYQKREGVAPPLHLVQQEFPTFGFTPTLLPGWASDRIKEATAQRKLMIAMRSATLALQGEDPDIGQAFEVLNSVKPPTVSKPPLNGLDDWLIDADDEPARIGLPYPTLQRATNGIGPGELWLLGGRPGEGKTHIASVLIANAMKQGFKVGLLSLEMPGAAMRRRISRALVGQDPKALTALHRPGVEHKGVMDMLRATVPGSLDIVDPSFGRITPDVVRGLLDEHDWVAIDHVGLLGTNAGGRAVDDWRNLGGISNQLIEDKLATGTPILGMTQLNRMAETGSKTYPPDKKDIAGADTLLQDADAVITMRRMSKHSMVYGLVKSREGPPATWYSHFDPAIVNFGEITREQALDQMNEDADV